MKNEAGEDIVAGDTAGTTSTDMAEGFARNNYSRPSGQNVGNFLTDRASSRVLAPPGGGSSIIFGDGSVPAETHSRPAQQPSPVRAAAPTAALAPAAANPPPGALSVGNESRTNNNYGRPEGQVGL